MFGRWSLQGETVTVGVDSVNVTSSNAVGPLVQVLISTFKKSMGGFFNVYGSSADQVVIVATTGQAQE